MRPGPSELAHDIVESAGPHDDANDATPGIAVYERIGLTERQRNQLITLLAELRANGNEFDVERSDELIEELGARHPRKRARKTA